MTEELVRVCDCNACRVQIDSDTVSPPGSEGAYCSQACAGHAGGTLVAAQAEHREETP